MQEVFFVDGVAITPSTLKISRCKEWAEGSGRSTSGNFIGDIKCKKWKFEVTVKCASDDEAYSILNHVDPDDKDYLTVKFKNPYDKGKTAQTTCYSSDTVSEVQSYATGIKTYSLLSFSLVGK